MIALVLPIPARALTSPGCPAALVISPSASDAELATFWASDPSELIRLPPSATASDRTVNPSAITRHRPRKYTD